MKILSPKTIEMYAQIDVIQTQEFHHMMKASLVKFSLYNLLHKLGIKTISNTTKFRRSAILHGKPGLCKTKTVNES